MTTPSRKRKRARTPAYRAKRMSTVKVLEKKVNRLVRTKETKGTQLWTNVTGTADPDHAGIQLYTAGQGDGAHSRDGDKLQPVSCKMNIMLKSGSDGTDEEITQFARIIVLRDTCGNDTGDAPTMTQVFGSATSKIGAEYDRSNRRKWDILYDKTVSVTQMATTYWNATTSLVVNRRYPREIMIKASPKVTGRPIYFNPDILGGLAYERGGLWLYIKGENPVDKITYDIHYQPLFKDD